MDKFWRWVVNEAEEPTVRTLHLEGYIAESSWFDDDITPKQFKTELYGSGSRVDDIVVKIHSPGGDTFAAAQIYNMLKEYPGKISVHIDGLAASAASGYPEFGLVWQRPNLVIKSRLCHVPETKSIK